MKNIYPNLERLFEETSNRGRKLSYTPEQLVEEFGKYVESLAESPIELVTEYKGGKSPGTKTERFSRVQLASFSVSRTRQRYAKIWKPIVKELNSLTEAGKTGCSSMN